MTGEIRRHDVDAIYEAAVQRARHLRWPPWPDLKPSRRRRRRRQRFILILSSAAAVLFAGLAVYAASAGWLGLPALQSALRSLTTFDRKIASAPVSEAIPQVAVAPAPENATGAPETTPAPPIEAPVLTVPAPPPRDSAPAAAETAPAPSESGPAPPDVAAAPTDHARNQSETAPPEAVPAPTEATPGPDSAAVPAEPAPHPPEVVTAVPPPGVRTPSSPETASAPSVAGTAAVQKEPAPRATSQPSFPLPPRRPVLAAVPAPAASAASPSTHAGAARGPQDALPPAPSPATGAGDTAPVGGGLVSHEPGAAPSPGTAAPSVAAAQRPCPDGAGTDCSRAHNWYVGAQLSAAANAVSTFTAPGVDVKGELEKLGGTNLFAGYKSNLGTRFEAELFYRRHSFSDVTVNSDGGAGTFLGMGDLDGTSGDGQGHLSMTGMMANVFQDFRLMESVTPFIGGGIGVARVNVSNGGLPSAALVDGDDDVFAYQIGGGVNFALDDRLDLFFEYRYFATDDYDMQYVTGDTVQGKITSHNFGVGLRYGF
jgi:opacity protein-like surface antigen